MTYKSRPMRVAIVSGSLSRAAGGILPIMQNHAVELKRRGFEVSAHGVVDEFSEADAAGWGDVPRYLVRPWINGRLAFAPALANSVHSVNPDLVHQHGIWQYTSVNVARWRRHTGSPVVISVQGMLEPWAVNKGAAKKRLAAALFERENLSRAAAIHCSRSEVQGVRSYGVSAPVAVLPNGARFPKCRELPRPASLSADGRRTLLFLGRLHPKKGISETMKAWRLLKDRAPKVVASWRLVFVGWDDGGHAETFMAEAHALGLDDDVTFPGPAFGPDKDGALRYADAFILASHSEGFPMAVLEAFANALPVFMTAGCNVPEAFEAGAAIEVTTDPEGLANVLARGLSLPSQELEAIGQRGAQLARDCFSWEAIAADLDNLYAYLLGRCKTRPKFLI